MEESSIKINNVRNSKSACVVSIIKRYNLAIKRSRKDHKNFGTGYSINATIKPKRRVEKKLSPERKKTKRESKIVFSRSHPVEGAINVYNSPKHMLKNEKPGKSDTELGFTKQSFCYQPKLQFQIIGDHKFRSIDKYVSKKATKEDELNLVTQKALCKDKKRTNTIINNLRRITSIFRSDCDDNTCRNKVFGKNIPRTQNAFDQNGPKRSFQCKAKENQDEYAMRDVLEKDSIICLKDVCITGKTLRLWKRVKKICSSSQGSLNLSSYMKSDDSDENNKKKRKICKPKLKPAQPARLQENKRAEPKIIGPAQDSVTTSGQYELENEYLKNIEPNKSKLMSNGRQNKTKSYFDEDRDNKRNAKEVDKQMANKNQFPKAQSKNSDKQNKSKVTCECPESEESDKNNVKNSYSVIKCECAEYLSGSDEPKVQNVASNNSWLYKIKRSCLCKTKKEILEKNELKSPKSRKLTFSKHKETFGSDRTPRRSTKFLKTLKRWTKGEVATKAEKNRLKSLQRLSKQKVTNSAKNKQKRSKSAKNEQKLSKPAKNNQKVSKPVKMEQKVSKLAKKEQKVSKPAKTKQKVLKSAKFSKVSSKEWPKDSERVVKSKAKSDSKDKKTCNVEQNKTPLVSRCDEKCKGMCICLCSGSDECMNKTPLDPEIKRIYSPKHPCASESAGAVRKVCSIDDEPCTLTNGFSNLLNNIKQRCKAIYYDHDRDEFDSSESSKNRQPEILRDKQKLYENEQKPRRSKKYWTKGKITQKAEQNKLDSSKMPRSMQGTYEYKHDEEQNIPKSMLKSDKHFTKESSSTQTTERGKSSKETVTDKEIYGTEKNTRNIQSTKHGHKLKGAHEAEPKTRDKYDDIKHVPRPKDSPIEKHVIKLKDSSSFERKKDTKSSAREKDDYNEGRINKYPYAEQNAIESAKMIKTTKPTHKYIDVYDDKFNVPKTDNLQNINRGTKLKGVSSTEEESLESAKKLKTTKRTMKDRDESSDSTSSLFPSSERNAFKTSKDKYDYSDEYDEPKSNNFLKSKRNEKESTKRMKDTDRDRDEYKSPRDFPIAEQNARKSDKRVKGTKASKNDKYDYKDKHNEPRSKSFSRTEQSTLKSSKKEKRTKTSRNDKDDHKERTHVHEPKSNNFESTKRTKEAKKLTKKDRKYDDDSESSSHNNLPSKNRETKLKGAPSVEPIKRTKNVNRMFGNKDEYNEYDERRSKNFPHSEQKTLKPPKRTKRNVKDKDEYRSKDSSSTDRGKKNYKKKDAKSYSKSKKTMTDSVEGKDLSKIQKDKNWLKHKDVTTKPTNATTQQMQDFEKKHSMESDVNYKLQDSNVKDKHRESKLKSKIICKCTDQIVGRFTKFFKTKKPQSKILLCDLCTEKNALIFAEIMKKLKQNELKEISKSAVQCACVAELKKSNSKSKIICKCTDQIAGRFTKFFKTKKPQSKILLCELCSEKNALIFAEIMKKLKQNEYKEISKTAVQCACVAELKKSNSKSMPDNAKRKSSVTYSPKPITSNVYYCSCSSYGIGTNKFEKTPSRQTYRKKSYNKTIPKNGKSKSAVECTCLPQQKSSKKENISKPARTKSAVEYSGTDKSKYAVECACLAKQNEYNKERVKNNAKSKSTVHHNSSANLNKSKVNCSCSLFKHNPLKCTSKWCRNKACMDKKKMDKPKSKQNILQCTSKWCRRKTCKNKQKINKYLSDKRNKMKKSTGKICRKVVSKHYICVRGKKSCHTKINKTVKIKCSKKHKKPQKVYCRRIRTCYRDFIKRRRRKIASQVCKQSYLLSMRDPPCVWLYHLCPYIYPRILGIISVIKTFIHSILFALACLVWCPCIIAAEFCRAFIPCVLCSF